MSPALAGRFFTTEPPEKPKFKSIISILLDICDLEEVYSLNKSILHRFYHNANYDYRSTFNKIFMYLWFPVAQMVNNSPAMQETWLRSLSQEDPLEKRMATHFSILTLRIPWTEKPGELPSMRSQSCT